MATQMIYHKDKWLSPAMRAFVQVAREVLGRERENSTLAVNVV